MTHSSCLFPQNLFLFAVVRDLNLTRGYTDELVKVCFALLCFVQLCFVPLCFPFVLRFSRSYVKVLPGFFKSRVCWWCCYMKLEKEVRDNIEMLKGIDDESAGYVAAAIAALEWVLK